jgi:DNA polymerase
MSSPARDLMLQYLGQLQARGVTHVAVAPEVWARPANRSSTPLAAVPARVTPMPAPASGAPAAVSSPMPVSGDKAEKLAALAKQAAESPESRALGTFRDVMVFATGNPDAEVMFIGEAPGAEEEKQREPFVGPAGQKLTAIIQAMGLSRRSVYISNICKFRPAIAGSPQGSKNRPPSRSEMDACLPFITQEIEIIQPRVIVALGGTAANGLGLEGSVGRLRGLVHEFRGIPVFVTYHPSYLLRAEETDGKGVREKRAAWEDMMRVMEHIGLPISDKQRRYFTKAG